MGRYLAVAVVALALVTSGCGKKDEVGPYVQALNSAQEEIGSQILTTSGTITADSNESEAKATFGRQAEILKGLATRLSQVKPPKGVESQHAALVAAIRSYATTLSDDDPALVVRDTKLAQERIHVAITNINGVLP